MFGWAKNAVGLTDKHHGASALHSVKEQTAEVPFTVLEKQDERWDLTDSLCLANKTFYITTNAGKLAFVQVQYTNVLNVKTTVQIAVKLFSDDEHQTHLWNSSAISDFSFSPDKYDFISTKCSLKLSEDGKIYTIESAVKNPDCTISLKFTQLAPSFMVGKDGTTYYGDIKKPSARIKHTFWPRAQVEGVLVTKEGTHDMAGKAMFVHALQAAKPHFAAAKWNVANFQSPTFSALSFEFTTPPSYDSVVVSVGCIAIDGKLIVANANSTATHVTTKTDPDSKLPEPKATTFTWSGRSADGNEVSAEIEAVFTGQRLDRIDVMDEVPKILKGIVTGATGVRPYIYQNGTRAKIIVRNGSDVKEEEGRLYCEATFIT